MFMDFKFFDDVVAKMEEQRAAAFTAWEQWIDYCDAFQQKLNDQFKTK